MPARSDTLPLNAHEGTALARIWMLGCGAMGSALAGRWFDRGLPRAAVALVDPAAVPAPLRDRHFSQVADAQRALPDPTLVVLAVKPQALVDVAGPLRAALGDSRPVIVSMLAGVRVPLLGQLFSGAQVVRIMPNTPARIGHGVTAIYAPLLDAAVRADIDRLLEAAGTTLWLDDESRFDAVTALSGSGPAFLFRFVEAMAGAGESAGLDPSTAASLARETVAGAAMLLSQSRESPAVLRAGVTSAGGTTQAGLDVLDGDGALSTLMRQTMRAAAERSRALAAAAESAVEDGQAREALRA